MNYKNISIFQIRRQWLLYLCLAFFLIIVMTIFSSTTSPLYPANYGVDSAFFRFVGKSIRQGKLPYRDIWDHKGPLIFYINTLGAIHGTQNEKLSFIFLMQIGAIIFSMLMMNRIDRMLIPTGRRQVRFFLLVVCVTAVMCSVMEGGNLTEEWSIPMICCSLYLFTKYAMNADANPCHPRRYAFLHGVLFTIVAFIRINNAVSVCSGLLVIGIYLIIRKKWKNLLENILFGIIGIAAVTIPICLYFYAKGALNDMLFGTFLYNLRYVGKGDTYIKYDKISRYLRYLPIIVSYIMILIHQIKKRSFRLLDAFAVTIVTGNFLLLLKNNTFLHYFCIFVPVFLFVLMIYIRFDRNHLLELIIISASFIYFFYGVMDIAVYYFNLDQKDLFEKAIELVPEDERKSFIAYNITPEIYLNKGFEPCSRFAAFQGDFFSVTPFLVDEFVSDLENENPKWIAATCDDPRMIPFMKNYIKTQYEYQFSEWPICFYRYK